MGKLNFGEGKASLALSPPPAEHTAHRWCKNVSEKQELSGGKFPVPGWTEKETKIKKNWSASCSCSYSAWWLNLSRAARNFHLKNELGVFFQGCTKQPQCAFEVLLRIERALSQFWVFELQGEFCSDVLFSSVARPFGARHKESSIFKLLCQREWLKSGAGCQATRDAVTAALLRQRSV